ncbi:MAG: hypothetical protein J6D01_00145, partial [Muribaculaceae bacterium]|nr:hypothetical protein [Muribaculaceae bacterium]
MSKNTPNDTDEPIDRMSDDDIEPAAEDVSEVEAEEAVDSQLPAHHHSLAEDLAKHHLRGMYRSWFLDY